jgi:DNA-3-methyladenine glycosylase
VAAEQAPELPEEGPALSRNEERALRLPKPLARSFYDRSSLVVARELLGRHLVRALDQVVLIARIVETEAYREDDPASHSYRGRTARTDVMFGPPGHLYVYFTYGMHFCMNVVTGGDGEGSAVLLRAAEPLEGVDLMRERRGVRRPTELCSGPARLTRAFGVSRAHNGADLVGDGGVFVARGTRLPDALVGVSPRIGIRHAAALPWRFFEVGSPFVSRPPASWPGRAAGERAP